ncbi:hypothetical protein CC78DRAFT_580687 [Lojkania enalia]|uniref:Uncharacterized protein n=1 Tax=Lojkania enalia TaxID=147567 RepID=A0A9P4MZV6_9PLEO|nr:hypothetical protein CC78DRAFT_580687 [Didymosphaeria enalia]
MHLHTRRAQSFERAGNLQKASLGSVWAAARYIIDVGINQRLCTSQCAQDGGMKALPNTWTRARQPSGLDPAIDAEGISDAQSSNASIIQLCCQRALPGVVRRRRAKRLHGEGAPNRSSPGVKLCWTNFGEPEECLRANDLHKKPQQLAYGRPLFGYGDAVRRITVKSERDSNVRHGHTDAASALYDYETIKRHIGVAGAQSANGTLIVCRKVPGEDGRQDGSSLLIMNDDSVRRHGQPKQEWSWWLVPAVSAN